YAARHPDQPAPLLRHADPAAGHRALRLAPDASGATDYDRNAALAAARRKRGTPPALRAAACHTDPGMDERERAQFSGEPLRTGRISRPAPDQAPVDGHS